jgi:hypothetical protein
LIFFTTDWVARSITTTSFDGPSAANSFVPSGESAMPQGRFPTSIVPAVRDVGSPGLASWIIELTAVTSF